MTTSSRLGGVIHTYRKYDPQRFPSPRQPEADLVSGAFEHLLMYGSLRELTDEELARAVRLDPSQIAGLGPSIEALRHLLEERKRKILERYETRRVQKDAAVEYQRGREQQDELPRDRHFDRAVVLGTQGGKGAHGLRVQRGQWLHGSARPACAHAHRLSRF